MNVFDLIVTIISGLCLVYSIGLIAFMVIKKAVIKRKIAKESEENEESEEKNC